MAQLHALPMTRDGRHRLQAQLDGLLRQRATLLRQYAADRLSESDTAVLALVQADLGVLDAQIAPLTSALAQSAELDPLPADGTVRLGSRVTVRWEDGEETTYRIVAPAEADALHNRISVASPVGQALLERRAGESVVATAPAYQARLYVVAVDGVPMVQP